MSLSDSDSRKHVPTVRRRKSGDVRKHWSDSQKVEAVQTYIILGSLKLVAGALKIPFDTLKLWKKSEWWKEIHDELMVQEDLQLSTRLRKIVAKSYDVVEDRLANGDFVYDQKSGEMRRKPVAMRDAHKVALDLHGKQQELIDRHMQEKTISVDTIDKRLKDLADSFAKIAGQVKNGPIEVTDVIIGKLEEQEDDAENEQGRNA